MTFTSFVSKIWDYVRHSSNILYPAFSIPMSHVIGPQPYGAGFRANKAYFELRLCEQFLSDKREYWNDYNPLTIVFSDFIYDGARRSFPFVLGPNLLQGLEQLEGDERVRYRNTRVAGPIPYCGDDIAIFVGLFRVKTRDWARQALSLLESVAMKFEPSKLGSYLNITDILMNSIESFFKMGEQMQFRLGQRDTYTDPETHSVNVFLPSYFVIIRSEAAVENEKFWVKDNQLYIGDNELQLQLYTGHDYILYQIVHLTLRNDYTTFDFHRKWEEVQRQIWDRNPRKAIESYQHLVALIWRCPDLIPKQKKQLALMYFADFQKELDRCGESLPRKIPSTDSGADAFNKLIQHLISLRFDKNAIQTIERSRDYLAFETKRKTAIRGPEPLDEAKIRTALNSQILNDPSVKLIDLSELANALSIATERKLFEIAKERPIELRLSKSTRTSERKSGPRLGPLGGFGK